MMARLVSFPTVFQIGICFNMALQKQAVSINLAAGLDTKTDSKHVVPGKLVTLENGVYRKGMAIDKRSGYDLVNNVDASDAELGVGSSLQTFNDELLQYNNQTLYGYSPSISKWVSKNDSVNVVIDSTQIIKNTASQTFCDSAILNGVGLYAWEDSRGGIRASVIDETTGSILLADVLVKTSGAALNRVKCLAFGQHLYVFYFISAQINAWRINPLSPTGFEQEVTVCSNVNASAPNFDVYGYLNERILIVANGSSSTIVTTWVDGRLEQLQSIFQPRTIADTADNCITVIEGNGSNLYLAYSSGSNVKCSILDLAARVTEAASTVETIANVDNITGIYQDNSEGVRLYYQVRGGTDDTTYIKKCSFLNSGTIGTPAVLIRSVGLWSKAFSFTDDNNIRGNFIGVTHASDLQATYFVVRDDGLVIGKQQYTNGGGLTSRPMLATVNQIGDSFSYALLKKNRIISENATLFTPTGVLRTTVDFSNSNRFIAKQLGDNLLIVGGILNMYDGQSVVEHGFLLYPERVVAAAVGSGGSLANGSYLVYVVYEWTDNFGQIHRSRPSVPVTVTCSAGGTDSISVTAPTLRLTRKDGTNRANISVVGYVTEANGSIAYRWTSVSTIIANDVTADTVALTTITTVSASNEILYTTGGVLPNDPAPACSVIEVFQNRAWLGGLEESSAVWYSKENKVGAPVEFSEEFTKSIASKGGKVSALSFIDDKLIAMKPDTAFITYGDGPNDTNTLGGFSEFESVSVDVGSQNPRSITTLPGAIILKTKKGFYSIDSTLNAAYIGADVEEFNSLEVTSANLIPDLNECRFTTQTGDLLIYNYYFQKWSTATDLQASSAVVWDNKYAVLKTNGQILLENTAIWKDADSAYGMKFESGWLSMGNIASFKRVYQLLFFGTYKSQHKVRVKIAYNNNDSWDHVGVYDPTTSFPVEFYGDDSPYGETNTVYGGKPIDYCIRVNLKRQKCSSFKFEFQELVSSSTQGTQQSLTISDLGILVGLKQGVVKKSQSRNMKVS